MVYGDYDVDGTTAAALMTDFLRDQGLAETSFFIPDRFCDGYGLCERGFDVAKERGATLVVALDCGITAIEEAAYARRIGLDLIICDHHNPKEELPDALAILDPKRSDATYPFSELSGCGLGFKLAQGVLARLGKPAEEALPYLDLVAVSTASDIVSLSGENRVLMREGLKRLRTHPRTGFSILARTARVNLHEATTRQIVFMVGPRINAAGRMGRADVAVELLLAKTDPEAARLAEELERINGERRTLDREITRQAQKQAREMLERRERRGLVLFGEDWHIGIIGIVASRVAETHHRPTVVLAPSPGDPEMLKGSVRSVGSLSIYPCLQACEHLLEQFGGHDFAAGVTLPKDHLHAFRDAFDEAVREATQLEHLTPKLYADARLDLMDVDTRFQAVLKQFAPYGPDNDTPLFWGEGLVVTRPPRTVGQDDKHLKFKVAPRPSSGDEYDVIAFGLGPKLREVADAHRGSRPIDLLFHVEENRYNGAVSMQLRAKDLRAPKRAGLSISQDTHRQRAHQGDGL
jgi:single-stranded-DNA-specific exonuclease